MYDRDYYRYECEDWDDIGYPSEFVLDDDVYIDEDYMDERWLPLYKYNPMYLVSTHGRVWSNYMKWFLPQRPYNNYGHLEVELAIPGKRKRHRGVHILVAEAFIPNPDGLPEVLHGDDDPTNNCVWNLRWGTQLDNVHDCIKRGRFRYFTDEDREVAMQKRRMPIIAYNIRTGEEIEFISQGEASRELGVSQGYISDIVLGASSHCGDWMFYKQGDERPDVKRIDRHYYTKNPLIKAISVETGEIRIYKGLTAASQDLDISPATISLILHEKTRFPKKWRFEYIDKG